MSAVFWIALLGSGASSAWAKTFDLLVGFENPPANPHARVIEASDGLLYGTTYVGGAFGDGILFRVNKDGTGFLKLHDFKERNGTDGGHPESSLLESSDGSLYGMTAGGGMYASGLVFKINKDGTGFLRLHDFNYNDAANGASPRGDLVESSQGALYGTTVRGGAHGSGIVFKVNKDGTGFLKIHDFDGNDPGNGSDPHGLAAGSDGALYGNTTVGGSFGSGTVFKINKDGSGFLTLHDFNAADANGAHPTGELVEGSDGALYGTTGSGGAFGGGTVFKLGKDGGGFVNLYDFPFGFGAPPGGVVEGVDGALYGTTTFGGTFGVGTVFRVNKDGTSFLTLHDLKVNDGSFPYVGLVEGSDGALYGTTANGGSYNGGVVFKINKDGSDFGKLHDFSPSEGAFPEAALLEGSDGVLYGTTYQGGAHGSGIVFRVNRDGTGFQRLHDFDFNEGSNGSYPIAPVIEGSDGVLYGTTLIGGSSNSGVVFKINKDGTGFLKLHDFAGGDGTQPRTTVVEGSDGALYGTAFGGGAFFNGVVFRVNKDGSGFQKLHDFNSSDPANGAYPYAELVEGSDGSLYGTTYSGGAYGYGIVFKINTDATDFLKLHDFNASDVANGANPRGRLENSDGALYGTTYAGGLSAAGTVFRINEDGTGFLKLHDLGGVDGVWPYGGLFEGSDGALYGTTITGGSVGGGVVFKINKDGSGFLKLHDFYDRDAANGAYPYGGVIEGSDGALYGTTSAGGPGTGGVAFRLALPQLSISDVSVNEGDLRSSWAVARSIFTITLSVASEEPVTVDYVTADGTATAPADYVAKSGTLTFEPGETSRTLTVFVKGDTEVEQNETFFVNLSAPTNATLADSQGVGTILDNDGILGVSNR